jgi:hypothetical protein
LAFGPPVPVIKVADAEEAIRWRALLVEIEGGVDRFGERGFLLIE